MNFRKVKYGPEKLQIRTLFTQCQMETLGTNAVYTTKYSCSLKEILQIFQKKPLYFLRLQSWLKYLQ